jgi:hypothetical protein
VVINTLVVEEKPGHIKVDNLQWNRIDGDETKHQILQARKQIMADAFTYLSHICRIFTYMSSGQYC